MRSSPQAAAYVVLERRLSSGSVPGFGHRVYRDRGPRAEYLLARLGAVAGVLASAEVIAAVLKAARALGLPAPNVDFAQAALVKAWDLPRSTAPAVFGLARITGLLAHGLEEYPHRLRSRPRTSYVGPAPHAP